MKTLIFILLPLCIAVGQDDDRTLAMTGIYHDGVVKLRWATGSTVVWNLIRKHGVILQRHDADDSLGITLNNNAPLRVWNEEQWKSRMNQSTLAAQVVTLLRDNANDRAKLTEYGQADLDRNTLTALLLIAEFRYQVAEGLSLAFRDSEVRKNALYRYRILLPDPIKNDTLIAQCYIDTGIELPLVPVTGLHAETGDGFIDLAWERSPIHSGYYVERRQAGRTEWQRLNALPKIYADTYPNQYLYRDSLANGLQYEYRVLGIDAFERESVEGITVLAQARDLTPPEPPYGIDWKKKGSGVELTWKNPAHEPDLAGYGLLRSRRPDDGYKPVHNELLKPGTTKYHDTLSSAGTYFYRLIAADTSGNTSSMSARAMAVIDDTIAPPPPTGLLAVADTTGVITLRWRQRLENDVAGYRVYRIVTGGRNPEFIPLHGSTIVDTVFRDTLMAGVRDRFYYRVRTVDFAGNYSTPSDVVETRFPDQVPPVAPVIERHSTHDRLIELQYVSASSDVTEYEIARREVGQNQGIILYHSSSLHWIDSTTLHGKGYYYEVVAIDSAGNRSQPSDRLYVKPFWVKELSAPPAPIVAYDAVIKTVRIQWKYPEAGYTAIVFRKRENGPLLQLSPLLTDDRFEDSKIMTGRYEYAIRFYYPEMGGTEMSKTVEVIVP